MLRDINEACAKTLHRTSQLVMLEPWPTSQSQMPRFRLARFLTANEPQRSLKPSLECELLASQFIAFSNPRNGKQTTVENKKDAKMAGCCRIQSKPNSIPPL